MSWSCWAEPEPEPEHSMTMMRQRQQQLNLVLVLILASLVVLPETLMMGMTPISRRTAAYAWFLFVYDAGVAFAVCTDLLCRV